VRRRGRGQQRIDDRQSFACIEVPPDLRDSFINRQYSLTKGAKNLFEPVFERSGLLLVA
jgi:hypothetical protein